jgi:hypothetical protein
MNERHQISIVHFTIKTLTSSLLDLIAVPLILSSPSADITYISRGSEDRALGKGLS